jgi:hypothetical protein
MVTRNGTKNTDQNITLWNVLQLMLRQLLRFVTFHTTLVWSACMESVWWTIQIMFTWLLSFWRVHLTLSFYVSLAQTFFQTHTHTHNTGTGTGRSMLHYVHHESPDFNERQIMQIAHDMADGLRYLHAMGLIHGNLCPSNVLLVAPYVVFEREILKT